MINGTKTIRDIKRILMAGGLLLALAPAFAVTPDEISIENSLAIPVKDNMKFSADVVVDALKVPSNKQVFITPVISDGSGNSITFPSLLINGRAMQIAWERGTVKPPHSYANGIEAAVRRRNGKAQTIPYNATIPMQNWMWSASTSVKWMIDTCGCGHLLGSVVNGEELLRLNPAERMRASYMVPAITPVPVTIHEGKAHVMFEVGESVLHAEPYVCRDGQPIDNRLELKIIDDSISNALSNKNMEIAKISICGYASPEGSYLGNQRLSTERSRSLANYIADRYKLPAEKSEYSAVAENWEGFRKLVEEDTYLSPEQRSALLELIDRPAYGPADYDDKETELKTNPKFRGIYNKIILPEWFPTLRTTKFEIQTRLKELTDEELADVIRTDPEKMSLNQMFRVSKLYPEGSPEFNSVIETMLRYYPDDEAANLNAASAALKSGNVEKAGQYLAKAGDSPEAWNARGILACWKGDMNQAREYFRKAGALSEASKNLEMLGN